MFLCPLATICIHFVKCSTKTSSFLTYSTGKETNVSFAAPQNSYIYTQLLSTYLHGQWAPSGSSMPCSFDFRAPSDTQYRSDTIALFSPILIWTTTSECVKLIAKTVNWNLTSWLIRSGSSLMSTSGVTAFIAFLFNPRYSLKMSNQVYLKLHLDKVPPCCLHVFGSAAECYLTLNQTAHICCQTLCVSPEVGWFSVSIVASDKVT